MRTTLSAFLLICLSAFYLLPLQPIYANDTPEIYLNELYPNPNADNEEEEFVEIYFESTEPPEEFEIVDAGGRKFSLSEGIVNGNLITIYTGKRYLNNDTDSIEIRRTNSGEIIQSICYGDICEENNYDYEIQDSPKKGESLSYFYDDTSFTFTIPTPETKNEIPTEYPPPEEPIPEIDYIGLIISEVFPNPDGKDEPGHNEWLEIYNGTDSPVDVAGIILARVTETKIYKYSLKQKTILLPGEYLQIFPSFTLTNSECTLHILDHEENIIDTFEYDITVGDNESIIRIENEIILTTTPTPGEENILTTENGNDSAEPPIPITNFTGLLISEIFPNPEGKDIEGENEWIEIQNISTFEIHLKGLVILQITSRHYEFTFEEDVLLKPGEYFLIYPGFPINNSTAKIELQNVSDTVFDSVFYDAKVKDGYSLARFENSENLELTDSPTPGTENLTEGEILAAATSSRIQDTKELPEESVVIVEGNVSVEKGVLSENDFYIQDDSGGIKITTTGDVTYELGEKIKVEGEMDTYHSEPRVKVKEEKIIEINEIEDVEPTEINTGDFGKEYIGSLVQISGIVSKTSGNTFYVDDGSGEIKITIKDSTGIIRPPCRKGYYARITGILSVWDKDDNVEYNYRLLPRYQEDVYISKTLANTGNCNMVQIFFGLCFLAFSIKNIVRRI